MFFDSSLDSKFPQSIINGAVLKIRTSIIILTLFLLSGQTFSQDNFGIERVKLFHNSWTSNGFRHQIVDEYVFLLKPDRYTILDLTTPENTTEIGTFKLQNRGNGDFKIVDNLLFHAHSEGLSLYDISNIEAPDHLDLIERVGGYTALAQRDTLLFACSSDSVFQIFSINRPQPAIISEMDINGRINEIAINGGVVFLGGEGLYIINIENIANPVILSETEVIVKDIEFFEDHVLIAADEDGIFLYDIIDLENPEVVWSLEERRIRAWIMTRFRDVIYVAHIMQEWDDYTWLEWVVLDFSDIENPRRNNCEPSPGFTGYAFEYGDYLYFTTNGDRINQQGFGYYVYSVENGFPPDSVGVYLAVRSMGLAAIDNNLLYAVESRDDRRKDIYVLDVQNPESPQTVSILGVDNANLSGYNGVLFENQLYLESENPDAIYCLDVGDEENPIVINTIYETPGSVTSMLPTQDYFYSTIHNQGLMITPMPFGERWFTEEIRSSLDVAIYSDYAYISTWYDGVIIADISDKENPTISNRIARQGHVRCVELQNDRLYLADGNFAIYTLDDPGNPELLVEYNPVDTVYDFHLYNDYVFARTARDNGRDPQIKIFDISNINNPEIIGQYYIRDEQHLRLGSMVISLPYIYMAHQSCIGIYDCSVALRVFGDHESKSPSIVCLQPAYPNPFNARTTISYTLPFAMDIEIGVYDLQGRQLKVLERDMKSHGLHRVDGLISGTYFIRMKDESGGMEQQETKVVLVK